jgi:hypothetical protein
MFEWLSTLPIGWMAVVVFAMTYLIAGAIYLVVVPIASGPRARAFKGISAGMLSPLGVIFGLFVAFVAAQVWSDFDRANVAVNREAGALRGVVLLAAAFPGETESRLRALVRQHITDAVNEEWPAMSRRRETLSMIPGPLAEALAVSLAITPRGDGQVAAQREIIAALGNALDARRQRIILSQSGVNWAKWSGLLAQGVCTLLAIALVHSDNRAGAAVALWLFATGMAVSLLLICSHNHPFSGEISVRPNVLLQVMPDTPEAPPPPPPASPSTVPG